MNAAAKRALIARSVPQPPPAPKPYARPGRVRALHHRCMACGAIILPSDLHAFRREAQDPFAVPSHCWDCAEDEAVAYRKRTA